MLIPENKTIGTSVINMSSKHDWNYYYVPGTGLSILYSLLYLIFISTLCGTDCLNPHFAGEGTEAQR